MIAVGLLLWGTSQSGNFRLGKEEEIRIRFPNVGGLEEGSPVRLNGVPVGVVRKIELPERSNQPVVVMGVKDGTRSRLHEGASARITTVGFLSELYVALDAGDESFPVITRDDQIRPRSSPTPRF